MRVHGLVLAGPRTVELRRDLVEPAVEDPRDAVVAITAAGLCGSDLHPYEGRERARFGVVAGHEIVGTVVATGDEVAGLTVGDRVLAAFTTSCGSCRFCLAGLSARCEHGQLFGYGNPDDQSPALHGGQSEFARVPLADTTMVGVPRGLSDAEAVLLTDNFPTAWYAVRQADVVPGDAVVVVGLGSVGLCAVVCALQAGAGSVLALDPVEDRRRRAATLGATVAHPEDVDVPRHAFPSVVEAAGSAGAQRLAFDLARPGGTLSIIAVQTADAFAFTPVDAYDANLTVRVGRAPVRSVLNQVMPLVTSGELRPPSETVVTHADTPLSDGPDMYRRFAAREAGLVKAVFVP